MDELKVQIEAADLYSARILVEVAALLKFGEDKEDSWSWQRVKALRQILGEIGPPVRLDNKIEPKDIEKWIGDTIEDDALMLEWRRLIYQMRGVATKLEWLFGVPDE